MAGWEVIGNTGSLPVAGVLPPSGDSGEATVFLDRDEQYIPQGKETTAFEAMPKSC